MEFFFHILFSGIATGAMYSLIAVGYSITFTTMRVLNFALGMWVMMGGMLTLTFHVIFGFNLLIALIAIIVIMALLGVIGERISVYPFLRTGSDVWVMSTLAVGFLFINLAELIWGRNPRPVPSFFGEGIVKFGPFAIFPQQILVIGSAFIIFVLLYLLYYKTLLGKAFRATAHSSEVTSLMAINTRMICILSYVITSVLAGVAGFIIVPITFAESQMGTVLGLKAFAIAIIAGLGAPRGILVCGIAYGAMEALVSGYFFTGIRDILGFSLMILVLFLKPEGLFGTPTKERA